jgi:predicted nucleic acid-binding protein
MNIVADTSALISLEAGGILEIAVEKIDFVMSTRIKKELFGISRNNDFEGNLAKKILGYKEIGVLEPSKRFDDGESEAAYLAKENKDIEFIITDDIASREKIEKISDKPIRFSTLIVYALCLKGIKTFEQGWKIIERMAVKRNWKDNLIFEGAKILWKK